jgi:hypothetical protein
LDLIDDVEDLVKDLDQIAALERTPRSIDDTGASGGSEAGTETSSLSTRSDAVRSPPTGSGQ